MRRKKGTGTVWMRPGGFWEGEITVGKDEFGKRIKKYATGATADEVLDKLAKEREDYLRASSRLQTHLSPSMTLRAFVDDYWKPSVRLGVSERSLLSPAEGKIPFHAGRAYNKT